MGCGISKEIHEQLMLEKDTEIQRLQDELEKTKDGSENYRRKSMAQLETNENQKQELNALSAELTAARSKLEATETELEGLQAQYQTEVAALASAKDELQRAIHLSKQAITCLHEQADDDGEPIAPLPEVAAVIHEEDATIPGDLKDTIRSVQDSVTEMKLMQKQIDLAQRKVNEYYKKIQAHEELILNQKKQILIVENRNEKLRNSDPNKRLLKRRNSTSSHKVDE